MTDITLLHIPRTGGNARRDVLATADSVHCAPQSTRLGHVPYERTPAVFLRDPVARFVSAYDYHREHRDHLAFLDTWPTCEALALALDVAWDDVTQQSQAFLPAVWWLDVPRIDLFVGRTETMEQDMARLLALAGEDDTRPLHRVNATRHPSTLSATAQGAVRERYAQDYEWWLGWE